MIEIFILGDGPLKEYYNKEIHRIQLETCFHFVDRIPHNEVMNYL